jgi:hypothetical protein
MHIASETLLGLIASPVPSPSGLETVGRTTFEWDRDEQ